MISKEYYKLIHTNNDWYSIRNVCIVSLIIIALDIIKSDCSNIWVYNFIELMEMIIPAVLIFIVVINMFQRLNRSNKLMNEGIVVEARVIQENSKYLLFDYVKIQAIYIDEYDREMVFNTVVGVGANIFIERVFSDKYRVEDIIRVNILVNPNNYTDYFILTREQFGNSKWPPIGTMIIIILALLGTRYRF